MAHYYFFCRERAKFFTLSDWNAMVVLRTRLKYLLASNNTVDFHIYSRPKRDFSGCIFLLRLSLVNTMRLSQGKNDIKEKKTYLCFESSSFTYRQVLYDYANIIVTCRDCTKNKTTGSGNKSCVWRIHPGYQKESASWTSDERKRNGINVWSMWSVKKFYSLFVDTWNKGNIDN